MLPGFRFLFAAIALSMSMLIFGLGATALLRAAHQEFASAPSWQPAPETRFARQESAEPVLALLRLEPVAEESKTPDQPTAVAAPTDPVTATFTETAAPAAKPDNVALLPPEDPSLSEAPQQTDKPATSTDATASEAASTPASPSTAPAAAPPIVVAAPAPADLSKADVMNAGVIKADVITIASTGERATGANASVSPSETVQVTPEAVSATAPPPAVAAPQRVAALGKSNAALDAKPSAKIANAKPDKNVLRKRLQARRAIQRRRIAARARLAAVKQAQTPPDPFAAPAPTTSLPTTPAR